VYVARICSSSFSIIAKYSAFRISFHLEHMGFRTFKAQKNRFLLNTLLGPHLEPRGLLKNIYDHVFLFVLLVCDSQSFHRVTACRFHNVLHFYNGHIILDKLNADFQGNFLIIQKGLLLFPQKSIRKRKY